MRAAWSRVDVYVLNVLLVVLAAGAGAGVMNWMNQTERMQLVDRFPTVRAEERQACVREFVPQLTALRQMHAQDTATLAAIKAQMDDTHEVVSYTLRFLGDRAKVTDARTAAMLRQTREAAAAAAAARATSQQVEHTATVAATRADQAANTAQAVSRRLDTAVQPPLPARPWAGDH